MHPAPDQRKLTADMAYTSPLETRIAKKVTRAIADYGLIENGDRVMVGLSGGKDSWALIQILDELRQRAPITFSLVAVTVDSGYDGYGHDLSATTCEQRGMGVPHEHTGIGAAIDETPSLLMIMPRVLALAPRLRRGVLYACGRGRRHEIAIGHTMATSRKSAPEHVFEGSSSDARKLVSDTAVTSSSGAGRGDGSRGAATPRNR